MKAITELNDKELAALSTEEILYYKKLACAEAGVPLELIPMPAKPVLDLGVLPEELYYEVAGFVVKTSEEAAKILETLSTLTLYTKSYKEYPYYYAEKLGKPHYDYPKVLSVSLLPKDYAEEIIPKSKAHKTLVASWESLTADIPNTNAEISAVHSTITELIESAQYREYKRADMETKFQEYMELAGQNTSIALAFLKKVIPSDYYQEIEAKYSTPLLEETPGQC